MLGKILSIANFSTKKNSKVTQLGLNPGLQGERTESSQVRYGRFWCLSSSLTILWGKLKFHTNLTGITNTSQEAMCTIMIISH